MNKELVYNLLCEARNNARKRNINALFSVHHEDSHLMRIGNSSVSLNTSESLTRLDITVFNGKKLGKHTQMGEINSIEYIENALEIARKKAEMSTGNAYELKVPVIDENISDINQYDAEMVNSVPSRKADIFKQIFNEVGNEYNYSGAWSSGSVELLIVSTPNDNSAWHKGTDMQFNLVLKHPTKKWEIKSSQTSWKFSDFSINKSIEEFKNLLSIYNNNKGIKLEPGEYTVAFGAEAIAEVLLMAVETGLKGKEYEEKQGWATPYKVGDKIFSNKISLIDDPTNYQTFCFKFDNFGLKRKPYPLIENGKLSGLAYDSIGSAKFNKPATGHSLTSLSLCVPVGTDEDDLLKATEKLGKVVVIPMLHYLGLPDMGKGIFTGSSRFNGILVENGKILGPIYSARITDSFANMFGNIVKISSKPESSNISNTYERRSPIALSLPSYIISENIKITDSSDSF